MRVIYIYRPSLGRFTVNIIDFQFFDDFDLWGESPRNESEWMVP